MRTVRRSAARAPALSGWLSRRLVHPLWDLKDRSERLKTLRELEATQWLSEAELRQRQWDRLIRMLTYAYDNCDYYKALFDRQGVTVSSLSGSGDVRRIPVLTKKDIQSHTDRLIARPYRRELLQPAKTGGSTGTSLLVFADRRAVEMRAAATIRSDRWARCELGDKRAAIWGNPDPCRTLKSRVRNLLLDRLTFLDTMNLSDDAMLEFVARWRGFEPAGIFGHSRSIYIFARFLERRGIGDLRPRSIISTSMMLLPMEREVIERVFECKVTDRYGCEEVGLIACECERHRGLHVNVDHLYVELVRGDGSPAHPGEEGQVVLTDLLNEGMPLIRYRVEDVAVASTRRCDCGRGLPLLERVTGRLGDFLVRRDGSLVAGVSLVERTLTAVAGLEQLQIVQEGLSEFRLHAVRMPGYGDDSERQLVGALREVFGADIRVRVDYGPSLPQQRSGKYRFAICKVARPDPA